MISIGFCGLYLFLTNVTFFAGSMDHKVDMPEIMTVWGIFFPWPIIWNRQVNRIMSVCIHMLPKHNHGMTKVC